MVEDDPDHLHVVSEILAEEGYAVEGAGNGRVALDRLLYGRLPDLIVVDLVMPVMDGWRLLAELQRRPGLAAIPVVVISGAGEGARFSATVSSGYLEKPLNAARLLQTVAACLAKNRRSPSDSPPNGG